MYPRIWSKFPREALPERFGEHLASIRVEAGLSQSGLAAACGTTRETIYRVENGRRPSSRVAFAMIRALGIEAVRPVPGWTEPADAELPCHSARIRHRRRKLGLTLMDVAKATGVTVATLSRFECETALPKKLLEVSRTAKGEVEARIISEELAWVLGFPSAEALDNYCMASDLADG